MTRSSSAIAAAAAPAPADAAERSRAWKRWTGWRARRRRPKRRSPRKNRERRSLPLTGWWNAFHGRPGAPLPLPWCHRLSCVSCAASTWTAVSAIGAGPALSPEFGHAPDRHQYEQSARGKGARWIHWSRLIVFYLVLYLYRFIFPLTTEIHGLFLRQEKRTCNRRQQMTNLYCCMITSTRTARCGSTLHVAKVNGKFSAPWL